MKIKIQRGRKSKKMEGWGGYWALLGRFLGSLARLGENFSRSWGRMGARWAKLGSSWRQVPSKMGHDGAKMGHDGAKMGHDSAKMGHDSAKMGILDSTWELSGAFWRHFLTISAPGLESEFDFVGALRGV